MEYVAQANGAKIILGAGDNPDSVRGLGYSLVVLDEFRDFKRSVLTAALGAVSVEPNQVIFCTTPKKGNKLIKEQLAKCDSVEHVPDIFSNPYVGEAWVKGMFEQFGTDSVEAMEEIWGEINLEDSAYFKREWLQYTDTLDGLTFAQLCVGLDPAFNGYTGLCVMARQERTNNMFILESGTHRTDGEWVDLMMAKYFHWMEIVKPEMGTVIFEENVASQVGSLLRAKYADVDIRTIRASKSTGGKVDRFRPLATQYSMKKVWHLGQSHKDYEDELMAFPETTGGLHHADAIDAAGYAWKILHIPDYDI